MTVDESDEMLRRIVFGRGFPMDQVHAASDELQRRASSSVIGERQPMVEALDDGEKADPATDQAAPLSSLPRRSRRVALAVAAVIGCGLGIVGTAGYYETRNEGVSPSEGMLGAATSIVDPESGQTVYEVPALEDEPDQAGADRWFAGPQTEQDIVPPDQISTTLSDSKYVGQVGVDAGAWIARSVAGEYCVIIAKDDGVTSAAGCSDSITFFRTGVYLASDENTMLWNPSSVIISQPRP